MVYRKPPSETAHRLTIAEFLSDAASSRGAPASQLIARMQQAKLADERAAQRVMRKRRVAQRRRRLIAVAATYLIACFLSLVAGVLEKAPLTAGIATTSSLAGSAYAVMRISRVSRNGSSVRGPARSGVFALFGWRGSRREPFRDRKDA